MVTTQSVNRYEWKRLRQNCVTFKIYRKIILSRAIKHGNKDVAIDGLYPLYADDNTRF